MPYFGGGYNPWPAERDGMSQPEIDQAKDVLRRAHRYAHPDSMQTMADRIDGEVAVRYQLPQVAADLLMDREVLIRQARNAKLLAQDSVVPQGKPRSTPRRLDVARRVTPGKRVR